MSITTALSIFEGLSLSPENEKLLGLLLSMAGDFQDFMQNYWKGTSQQFQAIAEFREDKLKLLHRTYDFELFEKDFIASPSLAVEKLCLEPAIPVVVEALSIEYNKNQNVLNQFYNRVVMETGISQARIIRKRRPIPTSKSW